MVLPLVTIRWSLPMATGIVLTTRPSKRTTIFLVLSSMVATLERPILKDIVTSCWP